MFMNRTQSPPRLLNSDKSEILIYDVIGWWGVTKNGVKDALAQIGSKDLTVRIASEGGDIFEANAIYNLFKEHPGKVTMIIDSLAASAASYIAMAGAERKMAANAMFMIHKPWGGTMGEAEEHRKTADLLDKLEDRIVEMYAARSGQADQQLRDWMKAETWFSAEEAKGAGFVDEVLPNVGAGAENLATPFKNLANFKNVPQNWLSANQKAGTPRLDKMAERLAAL